MIYYVGYYADEKNEKNRNICLSATNKMRYIINKLINIKYNLEIVSFSMSNNKETVPQEKILNNKTVTVYFKSLAHKNRFERVINKMFGILQGFFYLLKNVKKEDILIVYHSPSYCKLMCFLKKIKKFKMILEVEEIYSDVTEDVKLRKKEEYIFSKSDGFIFSTELLNEKINMLSKPYCVVYGTYQIERERKVKFNDNKIHVVYAGTFDPIKGGCFAAINASEKLNSKYHMHILGFGSENQIKQVKQHIKMISDKTECIITYDGLKSGEEYIKFIQSCDIGLSTQNPNGVYNDTSFPSKILSYMSNNLRVVSNSINVVKRSKISDYVYYYNEQNSYSIAKAILNVNLNDSYNGRKIVEKLDLEFCYDIKVMLEKLSNE